MLDMEEVMGTTESKYNQDSLHELWNSQIIKTF